jgi:hypothetical protein
MVVDDHDVALGIVGIHRAAGVRDDQQSGPQGLHHANRKGNLPVSVALVGMKTPFHGHQGNALKSAADELSGVADGGRPGEMRNGLVVQRGLLVDLLGHAAQPRPENDSHPRLPRPMRADRVDGLQDLCG